MTSFRRGFITDNKSLCDYDVGHLWGWESYNRGKIRTLTQK